MKYRHAAPLIAEIVSYGVTAYEVKPGGEHPHLKFKFAGRPLSYSFPASPSDHRWLKNALADIRRLMGVRRQIRKSGTPRRSSDRPAGSSIPALPATFTVKADPFEVLAVLRDAAPENPQNPAETERSRSSVAVQRIDIPLRTPWLGSRQRWQLA